MTIAIALGTAKVLSYCVHWQWQHVCSSHSGASPDTQYRGMVLLSVHKATRTLIYPLIVAFRYMRRWLKIASIDSVTRVFPRFKTWFPCVQLVIMQLVNAVISTMNFCCSCGRYLLPSKAFSNYFNSGGGSRGEDDCILLVWCVEVAQYSVNTIFFFYYFNKLYICNLFNNKPLHK